MNNPYAHGCFHFKFGVGWKKTGKRERNCKYKFMVFKIKNP